MASMASTSAVVSRTAVEAGEYLVGTSATGDHPPDGYCG
jgi:hypothetical protein